MKRFWLNSVFPVAGLYVCRMLGLFMLIPVFTLYAQDLHGATPTLIGMALGAYGLSQGILQLPFGVLSDRFGRKPMLTLGLLLFAAGSLMGACTHSIYGMIAARIIQGSGAIGSVLMALLADITPEEARTRAMAVIGASIGLSFSVAMVIGPILTHAYGLPTIFYFTIGLIAVGLFLVYFVIPTPEKHERTSVIPALRQVLLTLELQRLNLGIFCQHFILTSLFFVMPMALHAYVQQGVLNTTWHFYLSTLVVSFLVMSCIIFFAERKKVMHVVFVGAIIIVALSQVLLSFSSLYWMGFVGVITLYFAAFNLLEASLPAQISRTAPVYAKGAAMGVYSSCQFLGIFVGGLSAGVIYTHMGQQGVYAMNVGVALFWLLTVLYKPATRA